MDFTDTMYHQICEKLSSSGRTAITFAELISRQADIGAHEGYVVLRHDIDRMPERALAAEEVSHVLAMEPRNALEQAVLDEALRVRSELGQ
jgi:hypothetical protein